MYTTRDDGPTTDAPGGEFGGHDEFGGDGATGDGGGIGFPSRVGGGVQFYAMIRNPYKNAHDAFGGGVGVGFPSGGGGGVRRLLGLRNSVKNGKASGFG